MCLALENTEFFSNFVRRMRSSYTCFLLFITVLHIIAIWNFKQGFLLTRTVLSRKAEQCDTGDDFCQKKIEKFSPTPYPLVIILIIDALRYDFTTEQNESVAEHFLGKLKVFHEQPYDRSIYYDPPTTTLQRLKGITTGSLPTFIDMGSNFAGLEIHEDNFIDQLARQHKNRSTESIVFLGDDTWLSAFPNQFHIHLPFPSFNVFDLDTVDDSILEHLYTLVEKMQKSSGRPETSSKLLIAHFLGVDHCGHRYGPNHQEMSRKLLQMNEAISNVINLMKKNTLLLVIGDHGMDRKGDHGGDSELEISTALWAFSKNKLYDTTVLNESLSTWDNSLDQYPRTIRQIDLTPTLATLMNIPIPFGNLGTVIPELVQFDMATMENNAYQIKQFFETLNKLPNSEMTNAMMEKMNETYHKASTNKSWKSYFDFTREAYKFCFDIWAQFDVDKMALGVALLILSAIECFITLKTDISKTNFLMLGHYDSLILFVSASLMAGVNISARSAISLAAILFSLIDIGRKIKYLDAFKYHNFTAIIMAVVVTTLYASIFGSNSFIVHEDTIVLWLLQFIICFIYLTQFVKDMNIDNLAAIRLLICLMIMRIIRYSTVCREEQAPKCEPTYYGLYKESLSTPLWTIYAVFVSAISIPGVINVISGTKNNILLPKTSCVTAVLIFGTLHWTSEFILASPPILSAIKKNYPFSNILEIFFVYSKIWMPRLQFLLLLLQTVTFFRQQNSSKKNLQWPMIMLTWTAFFTITQKSFGQLNILFAMLVLIVIKKDTDKWNTSTKTTSFTFVLSILYSLIAYHTFFASGHQATLSSIQWSVGFIGLTDYYMPLAAILVALNTFGPIIWATGMLSMMMTFHYDRGKDDKNSEKINKLNVENLVICEIGILLFFTILCISSSVFAANFRRHLMVWKIFAPRWMLSALTLLSVDINILLFNVVKLQIR